MFLWHTVEDEIVNPEDPYIVGLALKRAGVNHKISMYPYGPHGIALANHITDCNKTCWNDPAMAEWVRMAAYWAENIKGD